MLSEAQISELNKWIKDCCGTTEVLGHYLDLAMKMLFYVEQGAFEQQELQHVVTVLRGLKRILS